MEKIVWRCPLSCCSPIVMHVLLAFVPRHPRAISALGASTLPVIFHVNLQTHGFAEVPQAREATTLFGKARAMTY